jgi:two-component system chemotaxis response regulator CheY
MFHVETLRVLLVEDSRPMRTLIREMLRALGFAHCECAASAEEAFSIMETYAPDLVITDYLLDGEDGINFTRRIRTLDSPTLSCTPIVLMSAHTERSNVQAAITAGVTAFLIKPLSARSLADHIDFALTGRSIPRLAEA